MAHGLHFFHFISTVIVNKFRNNSSSFSYTDSFDVLLDIDTGARISNLPDLYNIRFEVLDYVFIIIRSNGIYPPDYDVTGNLEKALSITLWKGDITQMRALMGRKQTFVSCYS